MQISEEIKAKRIELELSQTDLAKLAKVRQADISHIESGQNIELKTLNKVLKVLNGKLGISWQKKPNEKNPNKVKAPVKNHLTKFTEPPYSPAV